MPELAFLGGHQYHHGNGREERVALLFIFLFCTRTPEAAHCNVVCPFHISNTWRLPRGPGRQQSSIFVLDIGWIKWLFAFEWGTNKTWLKKNSPNLYFYFRALLVSKSPLLISLSLRGGGNVNLNDRVGKTGPLLSRSEAAFCTVILGYATP